MMESDHTQWAYILTRFGLVQGGAVEGRPGIPPTPAHLANLIQLMKDDKVKVIIVEPWNDVRLSERVSGEAGAKAVVLAAAVGALEGADTYLDAIDYNVRTLAQALQ